MLRRAIVLLLFALPVTATAQQWTEYRPAGGGYRVVLPGQPEVEASDMSTAAGPVKVTSATVEIGPHAFVAMHRVYPKGVLSDANAALDRGRDGALRDKTRTLREERRLLVGGQPARRLVVDATSDGRAVTLFALMVASGDALYQMIFVTDAASAIPADGERFLASFALLPR